MAALTLKELGRFLSDVSVSFSELTSSLEQQWSHFEIASDRLRQIYNDIATYTIKNLATLTSMRTKKEQISIDKRKILYFKDAVVPLSGKEESIVKSLNINSSNINDSKNTKLNDNPLSVPSTSVAVAFEYIYSTTVDFIQALTTISESSLTYQLLKSSHSLLSHHDDDSMSLPIICAEALAVQIFKVLPNNYVRFPGKGCGTFSEHRICCIDSNDLISHLAKTINQYNSKVNSSVLVSINATSVEMSSASASASASNNIKGKSRNNITFDTSGYATSKDDSTIPIQPLNTTNTSSDFIHKGLSSSPSHSNTKHSTVPAKKGLRKALSTTFDEKFKKAHSFIESVVHRVSTTGHLNAHDHSDTSHEISGVNNNSNSRNGEKLHTSSSGIFSSSKGRKTDDDIRDTQLLLQLLLASTPFVRQLFYPRSLPTNADNQDGSNEDHIDLNDGYQLETVQDITLLSPAEYLTWLMEIGTLQSITKSPENAFEGAKLYYRYRDPWEVHVADTSSHISATDFIRYGRNRYKSVVNNCGGNVLAPMIKTFKRYRERALSVTEQLQRRTSLALTPNKPGSTELDEEEEEFKRKLVSLWETLKAESWLVTTISSTSTEDQSVSAVGDVVLGTGVDRVSVSRAHSTGDDAATIDSECSPPRRHLLAANDGIWRSTNGSGDETYLSCLSRHMFRNALFHRLGLPHRFTVSVQVDIFGLKEVGSKDGFSFVHMTSGIELYGILSLGRKRRPNLSQINLVKAPIDGSTVTKPAHAELLKLPSGSHGTEYTWRERTKFKFAFPEELHAHSIHNVKGLDESSLQSGDVWTTNILDPPQMLYLSVYEKTFFADTKLGELSLPMSQLTINR